MKKKLVKAALILLSMVVTLFYIGPLITSGDKSLGVVLGLGFALVLIIYAVLFDKINHFAKKIWKNKRGKIACIVILAVLCTGLTIGGTAFANVVKYSSTSSVQTEYAILLGCKVNGSEPGIFLRHRINAAYDYLQENPNAKIILSGGQGQNEDISEAQCMYNTLLEKGVAEDRMIIEDKSTSTQENFKNSLELMKQKGIDITELTVITNDFHEYRASQFAKREGITTYSHPCKTPWNGYMPFATREAIAVVVQVYLGL